MKVDAASLALAFTVTSLLAIAPESGAQPDDVTTYCQNMRATGYLQSCATRYSYGRGTCIQFDKGTSWYNVLQQLDAATDDRELAPAILVTAVADLCPWHESKLPPPRG